MRCATVNAVVPSTASRITGFTTGRTTYSITNMTMCDTSRRLTRQDRSEQYAPRHRRRRMQAEAITNDARPTLQGTGADNGRANQPNGRQNVHAVRGRCTHGEEHSDYAADDSCEGTGIQRVPPRSLAEQRRLRCSHLELP